MDKIDKAKMFAGLDFVINDKLVLKNPLFGDVIKFGEERYYSMIGALTSIPSDFKSKLFDSGIDYEELDDFELFIMMTRPMGAESTRLIFGDLDLSKMKYEINEANGEPILKDESTGIVIDKFIYLKIMEYVRTMHNVTPKIEKAANEWTKKALIEDDRTRIKMRMAKEHEPFLFNLMVSIVNTEEFKYNTKEVMSIPLYEFIESVNQIQRKKQVCALIQGSYSGMVDMSKIDKKNLNWIKAEKA